MTDRRRQDPWFIWERSRGETLIVALDCIGHSLIDSQTCVPPVTRFLKVLSRSWANSNRLSTGWQCLKRRRLAFIKLHTPRPNSPLSIIPGRGLQQLSSDTRPSRKSQFPLPSRRQLPLLTHRQCLGRVTIGRQLVPYTPTRTLGKLGGGHTQDALISRRSSFKGSILLLSPPAKAVLTTHLEDSCRLNGLEQVVPNMLSRRCSPPPGAGQLLTTRGASYIPCNFTDLTQCSRDRSVPTLGELLLIFGRIRERILATFPTKLEPTKPHPDPNTLNTSSSPRGDPRTLPRIVALSTTWNYLYNYSCSCNYTYSSCTCSLPSRFCQALMIRRLAACRDKPPLSLAIRGGLAR